MDSKSLQLSRNYNSGVFAQGKHFVSLSAYISTTASNYS